MCCLRNASNAACKKQGPCTQALYEASTSAVCYNLPKPCTLSRDARSVTMQYRRTSSRACAFAGALTASDVDSTISVIGWALSHWRTGKRRSIWRYAFAGDSLLWRSQRNLTAAAELLALRSDCPHDNAADCRPTLRWSRASRCSED